MKKLALLLGIAGFTLLNAETHWGNKVIEFKTLMHDNKIVWHDFSQEMTVKKKAMKKRHKQEWFDFYIGVIKEWKDTNVKDEAAKQALFKKNLEKALVIYKRQAEECKNFYERFCKEGKDLGEKQEDALEAFEEATFPKKSLEEKED